jgi:hypothetical protein
MTRGFVAVNEIFRRNRCHFSSAIGQNETWWHVELEVFMYVFWVLPVGLAVVASLWVFWEYLKRRPLAPSDGQVLTDKYSVPPPSDLPQPARHRD